VRAASIPTSAPPEITTYWSDGKIDRPHFLDAILSKLDQAGWSIKSDTGWTAHDAEIPVQLWTRLRLATVGEELAQGRRHLRCRIRGSWSLPAKFIFGMVLIAVLSAILTLAQQVPWVWLSLTALPLAAWWFEDEKFTHQAALAALIDTAAKDLALVKLEPLAGKLTTFHRPQ
jgi:hypothetical protein